MVIDIDHALVEGVRPPLYTAMKYWGKKPHNIWRQYIERYTPQNGVFLDPFMGSGISVFEAYAINRNAIGFDLNPLSSFFIEVLTSNFNFPIFKEAVGQIIRDVEHDTIYQKFYVTNSRKKLSNAVVQHFKWEYGKIYEIGIMDINQDGVLGKKYITMPVENDHYLAQEMLALEIPFEHPSKSFPKSPSFSASFIQKLGGNDFSKLWTSRNLYIISLIFKKINDLNDLVLRKQMLFGFIQMLHLTTKMCIPRRNNANRPFSTSWGRSAYLCSARSMEMNPLLVFEGCCLGKQSVQSALESASTYFEHNNPSFKKVSYSNKRINDNSYTIKYGTVDVNSLDQYVADKSVDFVMTDPPYGGLVQYLDLSYIWLSWLEIVDKDFTPNFDAEITIKKDKISREVYRKRLTNAFTEIKRVLKDNGKIIFTFHNKEISVWNDFLYSIKHAGLKIEKVIHQQNRRSGESVVANPYGTSGTDFYIRCVKDDVPNEGELQNVEKLILDSAIQLVAERNEPTPYQILFNGILAEISQSGFELENFDINVENVLKSKVNDIFVIKPNTLSKSGNFWWLKNPRTYIKYPDMPLTRRVEDTVLNLLRRKISVAYDTVLAEIFIKYPNGLTPDIKAISFFLEKFATKSSGKWLYKQEKMESEISHHTRIIAQLSRIAKSLGYENYIGKREQWEKYNDGTLADLADYRNLNFLELEDEVIKRIEMIDIIWLKEKKIKILYEIENSTNMISALQRASNLRQEDIQRIMVIPDEREHELKRIKDPMFQENFSTQSWRYLRYNDVDKLSTNKQPDINIFLRDIENNGW